MPAIDREFVERMEDVLRLYARPYDPKAPVVCFDERPVVLRDAAREGAPMAVGRAARADYEYVREGTANVFCIVEPKTGRRLTHATSVGRAPASPARSATSRVVATVQGPLHTQARELAERRGDGGESRLPPEPRDWRAIATHAGATIRWRFRVSDARRVFKYDALPFTRSEH